MRWKISHGGHDSRHVDLLAAVALLILILAAWRFFSGPSENPGTSALIVPSQSVRW
jgi:hypothetical protein